MKNGDFRPVIISDAKVFAAHDSHFREVLAVDNMYICSDSIINNDDYHLGCSRLKQQIALKIMRIKLTKIQPSQMKVEE